jgi:S1-C subfamily serine protease
MSGDLMKKILPIWLFLAMAGLIPGGLQGQVIGGNADASAGAGADPRITPTVRAVNTAMPAVVNISTEMVVMRKDRLDELYLDFYGRIWGVPTVEKTHNLGSGVIIDPEGYLVTNYHVIERASRIRATMAISGEVFDARLIASMPETDLTLLKIDPPGPGYEFPFIEFENVDDLILGEEVMTLGNPFGLGGSVSRGILSSKNRRQIPTSDQLEVDDWLQTDAAINLGNSGGPLINIYGRLIGINVATISGGENIGFAIPIRRVMETIAYVFNPEKVSSTWVGLQLDPVSTIPFVLGVEDQSPAARAGFREGDQITHVNDLPIDSLFEIQKRLTFARPNTRLMVSVIRQNGSREVLSLEPIRLGDHFNADYILERTGLELREQEYVNYQSPRRLTGYQVLSVDKGSPAESSRIQPGDILVQINENSFESFAAMGWWMSYYPSGTELTLRANRPFINRFGLQDYRGFNEPLTLR